MTVPKDTRTSEATRVPRPRTPMDGQPAPLPDATERQPTVLVVVGTDVHQFGRLMDWLTRWHAKRGGAARLVVQHGHTPAPALPGAVPFLDHDRLQEAMAEATLVISHGGPATITEARRNGHLPIVVPRDPTLREHVDNHQQLFARRLGAAGMVRLCETEAELVATLDAGLAEPKQFALVADTAGQNARAEAVARVGRIVEDLVAAARGRRASAGGRGN